MPRRQTIPAYRLHVQSGQARVILNGRHIYLGRFDSPQSRAAYDQLVRKLLTDRASAEIEARALVSKDLTVAEVAAAYLKFARVYYTKNGRITTEFNHIFSAVKAVTDRHSHELVTQFGPPKLKKIRADWVAAGLVRRQINKRMDRIKRMIGWAVEEELCPASVHHALKSILGLKKGRTDAPEGKKVLPVPEAWVDGIRSHVCPQIWAMIRVQSLTGMRPGEVVLIRTIDINTTGKIWEYRPLESKMEHEDRDRLIFLGPQAQEILLPWLRPELEASLFSPREVTAERFREARQKRKTRVQPSQQNRSKRHPRRSPGERYTARSYARAIRNACLNAGVPHWAPNQLRHLVGIKIRRELGLEASQVVLGLAHADVTQIYAERNAELARQATEKLG